MWAQGLKIHIGVLQDYVRSKRDSTGITSGSYGVIYGLYTDYVGKFLGFCVGEMRFSRVRYDLVAGVKHENANNVVGTTNPA